MAMSIEIDIKPFEEFRDALKNFQTNLDDVFVQAINEIALRELRLVKKDTPVDTGHLRDSWYLSAVKRVGKDYEVKLTNDAGATSDDGDDGYASFVEYGHRTRDHKGWVPGVFMLRIAEQKIETVMEEIVQRRIEEAFIKL